MLGSQCKARDRTSGSPRPGEVGGPGLQLRLLSTVNCFMISKSHSWRKRAENVCTELHNSGSILSTFFFFLTLQDIHTQSFFTVPILVAQIYDSSWKFLLQMTSAQTSLLDPDQPPKLQAILLDGQGLSKFSPCYGVCMVEMSKDGQLYLWPWELHKYQVSNGYITPRAWEERI